MTVCRCPECECAMTESSLIHCPVHGYDAAQDDGDCPIHGQAAVKP